MSLEKAYNIYNQFKSVEIQMAHIRKMYEDTKALELNKLTAENPGFVEAAYELLDFVKDFVKEIEESDTNLDPELTKLMGVANLFEGHPATEFVNNAINEVYNSQGICTNAPCKAEDKNCCMNKESVDRVYGDNEIRDELFEGLCWCQFKRKLKRMNLTVGTAPISGYMLSSIEATRGVEGECFHCSNAEDRPCGPECTDPCPCFDK